MSLFYHSSFLGASVLCGVAYMKVFSEVLDKIDRKLKRMAEQLETTRWLADAGQFGAAYEHAMHLEDTAERLTLLTRVLPCYTGRPNARSEVEKVILAAHPVEIGFTAEGWFSLRIPLLLPKKEAGSTEFIRAFLYPAVHRFFKDKEPVRYTDCVSCPSNPCICWEVSGSIRRSLSN